MEVNNIEHRMSNGDHKDEEEEMPNKRKKGGFITMPFILANEAFERVASFSLIPNMIIYLMHDYKMSVTKAQNFIFFWSTFGSLTPVVGALVADCFVGRFLAVGIGSIFSLLGMIVLWLTTVLPHIKPSECSPGDHVCESGTAGQYAVLIIAFVLMSIGAGGIRPCAQPFGADQVYQGDNPKSQRALETFLNWYYLLTCLSIIIAMTGIVYIQENMGWRLGFGVPVILMFLSALCFFLATPLYIIVKGSKHLIIGLAQVVVAAYKNRKMDVSAQGSNLKYYQGNDSNVSVPSSRLRFMDKACIIQDPDNDITPDGLPANPWRLCKVEDVEVLKSIIRVLPIWSCGIIINLNTSSNPFSILLTRTMDRHLGPKFQIPAASFGTILILVILIWIPLYDRVLIPVASKIRGKPVHICVKVRMGAGLFCGFLSMVVAGLVESLRRHRAISEGFENDPNAVLHMSALWTIPHSVFTGLAEALCIIGQLEFFYTELPQNMLSIASAIFGLSTTFGGLLATLILNVTTSVTKRGGKDGWIANNVNKGHYDYYYYLIAVLNFLNLIYYVFCSRAYGPVGERRKAAIAHQQSNEQQLTEMKDTSKDEKGD